MNKVLCILLFTIIGYSQDTISYNLTWGSALIVSPGESLLMVYKLYKGQITGINIPIKEWGTGDQQLSIEIYELQYPHDSNGDIYPSDSVESHGWLGGWHDGIHFDSLFVDSSDVYNVWNQFPNDEGACTYTGIVPNSFDPLGERLWPTDGNLFIMMPFEYPDINSGGANFWIDIPNNERPFFECDDTYIGIVVRSIGNGGGDDPNTGFLYADGNLLNIDFRPFLKFYTPCNGTSGEGGWHIRHWVLNWGLSFIFLYDRPPVWFINCLPLLTLSTDSMKVCGYMDGWDTYCFGIQDSAELRYSIDGEQTWINKEMSIKDTIWSDFGYYFLDWEAYIPGQPPGTQIIWKIVLLSSESDHEQPSGTYQYLIFQPVEQNLFYYNTNSFAPWIQNYYLNNIDFPADFWGGYSPPGPVELFQNYDVILEITGALPTNISIDTLLASGFFEESGHAYILTGDNWLECQTDWQDTTYGPSSFQYEILGIDSFVNDINYEFSGDQDSVSMLLPVENNPISGDLFNFLGDSLALYYDPNYELGFSNRLDGLFPTEGTEVAYWGLTGVVDENGMPSPDADTLPVGIYRQLDNGIPIVFLAFDPLAINTKAIGDFQSGYHWIGYSQYGPLPSAVRWLQVMLETESEEDLALMPSAFYLHQNYPNPFNPITTIRYDLPKDSYVRLSVINLLGREVQVLVDEFQAAGIREIQLNAGDLASGVYFYRIEAGKFSAINKMILLK